MAVTRIVHLLFASVFIGCWHSTSCRHVYIDKSYGSCNESSSKCNSLEDVMKRQDLRNTSIFLLSNITINEVITVRNVEGLSISSNRRNNSITILCNGSSSLKFQNSTNLTIANVSFHNCGSIFEIGWNNKTDTVNVSAALLFDRCVDVKVTNTTILSGRGYGIMFIDSNRAFIDFVNVTNSTAIEFSIDGEKLAAAGGLFVQFYSQEAGDNNYFSINNSNFADTLGPNGTIPSIDTPYEKAGGMGFFFSKYRKNNKIILENVSCTNNSAGTGAGVYVNFLEFSSNNTISFNRGSVTGNNATSFGGGFFVKDDSNKTNLVQITNVTLGRNKATVGGALCFVSFRFRDDKDMEKMFQLRQLRITDNYAQVGSSLHAQNVHIHLHDIIVSNSSVRPEDASPGQGSVYALRSFLQFSGDGNSFRLNNNSAIILDSSELHSNGTMDFLNNTGYNGGAIAFYEHSELYLYPGSRMLFKGNRATNKGGAMYVLTPGPALMPWKTTELNMYGCFINFRGMVNSKTFDGNITFDDDNYCKDGDSHDIFASSLQNCRQPGDKDRKVILSEWSNFTFRNWNSTIATNAVEMQELIREEWSSYPGALLQPRIVLTDERGNHVSESIIVLARPSDNVQIETNPAFVLDQNDTIKLSLTDDKNRQSSYSIIVRTTSDIYLDEKLIDLKFKNCSFGFTRKGRGVCECDILHNQDLGIAVCDDNNIQMERNRWVNLNLKKSFVCPADYCHNDYPKDPNARYNTYNEKQPCAPQRDQTSRLCGACKDGFSAVVGSRSCLDCKGTLGVTWISLLIIAGLSAFILLVMVLNLDIMSYNINICLYAFQVVDMLYTSEQTVDPFISLFMSIFQFNSRSSVFPPSCLWNNMNALEKTAYGYLIPVWMMLFMALLYAILRKHSNKWMNMKRWYKTSSIVSVMCFTDLLRVSFELLHFINIGEGHYVYMYAEVEIFGKEHLWYGVVAILVCIIILIFSIAQILVLLKSVILMEWLRELEEKQLETYFKAGKYWFWIFYFVCRFFIYAIGIFLVSQRKMQMALLAMICFLVCIVFANQQPYSDASINLLETIVLATLAVISIFSMGIRNVFLIEEQLGLITTVHVLSYVPLLVVAFSIAREKYNHCWNRSLIKRTGSKIPDRVWEHEDNPGHPYQRLPEDDENHN